MTPTDYARVFEAERVREYPIIDAFEARMGFAIGRDRLEEAARVLACPLKNNPPNWQHGRVLYAAARRYFAAAPADGSLVDIGTAKGFSALCVAWAQNDTGVSMPQWSCDVIDPSARVRRNTVAEVNGLKTLAETLSPWPEASAIQFVKSTGIDLLKALERQGARVAFAFVDGKHTGEVVAQEGRLLARLQQPGDIAVFDDLHLPDIAHAVQGLSDVYTLEILAILPNRAYAVGVRRG